MIRGESEGGTLKGGRIFLFVCFVGSNLQWKNGRNVFLFSLALVFAREASGLRARLCQVHSYVHVVNGINRHMAYYTQLEHAGC